MWCVLQREEPNADAQHWGFIHIEGPEQNKHILFKNKWQNKTNFAINIDTITSVLTLFFSFSLLLTCLWKKTVLNYLFYYFLFHFWSSVSTSHSFQPWDTNIGSHLHCHFQISEKSKISAIKTFYFFGFVILSWGFLHGDPSGELKVNQARTKTNLWSLYCYHAFSVLKSY